MKKKYYKIDSIFLWFLIYLCALQAIAPLNFFQDALYPRADYSYEIFTKIANYISNSMKDLNLLYQNNEPLSPFKVIFFSPLFILKVPVFKIIFDILSVISLPISLFLISKKTGLKAIAPLIIMTALIHPALLTAHYNPSTSLFGFFSLACCLYFISDHIKSGLFLSLAILFEPLIFIILPILIISKQYKLLSSLILFLAGIFFLSPIAWIDFWAISIPNLKELFFSGQYGFNYSFALFGIYFSENGYAKGFEFGLLLYLASYLTLITGIFAKIKRTKELTDNEKIIPILLSIPFIIMVPGLANYESYCIASFMIPLIFLAFEMGFACTACKRAFGILYMLTAVDTPKAANIFPSIITSTVPQVGLILLCLLSCVFALRWAKYNN